MIRVLVESPFAGTSSDPFVWKQQTDVNLDYLRAAMADCLKRGEAPFASHGLYTQPGVLDDKVPEERKLGIEAGLLWGQAASKTVVYVDRGISGGMQQGIERAIDENREVEFRNILGWETGEPLLSQGIQRLSQIIVKLMARLRTTQTYLLAATAATVR